MWETKDTKPKHIISCHLQYIHRNSWFWSCAIFITPERRGVTLPPATRGQCDTRQVVVVYFPPKYPLQPLWTYPASPSSCLLTRRAIARNVPTCVICRSATTDDSEPMSHVATSRFIGGPQKQECGYRSVIIHGASVCVCVRGVGGLGGLTLRGGVFSLYKVRLRHLSLHKWYRYKTREESQKCPDVQHSWPWHTPCLTPHTHTRNSHTHAHTHAQ